MKNLRLSMPKDMMLKSFFHIWSRSSITTVWAPRGRITMKESGYFLSSTDSPYSFVRA